MKKIGRRSIEKIHRVVTLSDELRGHPEIDALLDKPLAAHQGDVVAGLYGPGRYVLMRPVDEPKRDIAGPGTDYGWDFLYSRFTVRQTQCWEVAYIGRGK